MLMEFATTMSNKMVESLSAIVRAMTVVTEIIAIVEGERKKGKNCCCLHFTSKTFLCI